MTEHEELEMIKEIFKLIYDDYDGNRPMMPSSIDDVVEQVYRLLKEARVSAHNDLKSPKDYPMAQVLTPQECEVLEKIGARIKTALWPEEYTYHTEAGVNVRFHIVDSPMTRAREVVEGHER